MENDIGPMPMRVPAPSEIKCELPARTLPELPLGPVYIFCVPCEGSPSKANCYTCGGFGYVLAQFQCYSCRRPFWSKPFSRNLRHGKEFMSFDGLKMVWQKNPSDNAQFTLFCKKCSITIQINDRVDKEDGK